MITRNRESGFSLVELMVALLLTSITAVVVLQVLTSYQSRKATTVGRNDAQISASVGLYMLEKEIRMAGAGLMIPTGQLCPLGVNIYYDGATISDAAPLMPLRIIDGGAGPDTIEIMRSGSEFGAAPTRLIQTMASTISTIGVDSSAGLVNGDLILVGSPDGNKICTVMQLSQDPIVNGSGWTLAHASGASIYNPANPAAVFTTAMPYDVRDKVVNLGQLGVRRHGLVCSDGGAPSANNICDLGSYDALANPAPTLATFDSAAPQIIELQGQYGVAAAGSQTVTSWEDPTGATWGAPTLANQGRIKAVRIALIARGAREGTAVSPATLRLWDADGVMGSAAVDRALSADEQRFRYQVLNIVVPLVNVIWAGL
jgi:type IV pilus assembly protein PilW